MGDLYRCELHLNKVFTVWNIVCLNSNICSLPLKYKTKRPNFPGFIFSLQTGAPFSLYFFQPFSWPALCCLYHCIYCFIYLCRIEGSSRPGSLLHYVSILHNTWPALPDEYTTSFCHLTEWLDGIWLGMIPGMILPFLASFTGAIRKQLRSKCIKTFFLGKKNYQNHTGYYHL